MSGPYPGYPPQPEQGDWSGGQPYGSGPSTGGYGHQGGYENSGPYPVQQQTGQFGTPTYGFPTVEYGGLGGNPGGWGEPPRRNKGHVGRMVVVVVSVLVIVGGVATGIVLLTSRGQQSASPSTTTSVASAPARPSGTSGQSGSAPSGSQQTNPDLPNGTTTLALTAGSCVTAVAQSNNEYALGRKVVCGTAESDLVLAQVAAGVNGCADHQYLRVRGANAVYCFTLDVKLGDCLDNSYIKIACGAGTFTVLKTEPGPGTSSSCGDAHGATHWVPVGRDPVVVGCIGPTKTP